MLPSTYPYDEQSLADAWKGFAEGGEVPSAGLDPAVVRSWRHCRDLGLDPCTPPPPVRCEEEELERRRYACFDLIAIARPFMEDIYQFAGESDMIVYLADDQLYMLEQLGDGALMGRMEELGFTAGVHLAEEQLGTNAASVALREGMPAQIAGAEHFFRPYHFLTDTATGFHAPSGKMMGVIGIVTLESNSNPHTLSIVMAAARAIENQLQAEESFFEAHRHLTELNAALEAMRRGILFLNPEGVVLHVNARAGAILEIPQRQAMGRRLSNLTDMPPEVELAISQQTSLEESEIVFRTRSGARSCLVSMHVLTDATDSLGFVLTLERTAEVRRLVQRMAGTRAHFTFEDILGEDPEMRRVFHYARTVAQSDSTVLLLGESGTGKEMFAQAIHNASRRADGPFVAVNCGAIPRESIASELFGREGTLAGGQEGRPGKFELADGGTIFFDNVDGLRLDMQASLLRVIDTRELFRLRGTRPIPLNLRVIAASNKVDLAEEVQHGRFRADLFYRLHVLTLTIPPLRERGNDILLLIAHLTEKFARQLKKSVTVSPRALAVLQSYNWPGNVRELENVLERAMYVVEGGELGVEHLPYELRSSTIGGTGETLLTLQEAERQAIIRAGRALGGNTTEMAKALGIGRTTLWRKMKLFKLDRKSFEREGRG